MDFVSSLKQTVNLWKRGEQWPLPVCVQQRPFKWVAWISSLLPLDLSEQEQRAAGDFFSAHIVQCMRFSYTMDVVFEALRAWNRESMLPPSLRYGLVGSVSLLFFIPREGTKWKSAGFIRDHLSDCGLAIQLFSAWALERKGQRPAAIAIGSLGLERTIEYLGIIPKRWRTTLSVVRFFSPQILDFLLPFAYGRADKKRVTETLLLVMMIGLGILVITSAKNLLAPIKIPPEKAASCKPEQLVINPELDLQHRAKSILNYNHLPADADVDVKLESWFYSKAREAYQTTVKPTGYWATQCLGSVAERQARWPVSSIVEAKNILNQLPAEIRNAWMQKHSEPKAIEGDAERATDQMNDRQRERTDDLTHALMLMQLDFARQKR